MNLFFWKIFWKKVILIFFQKYLILVENQINPDKISLICWLSLISTAFEVSWTSKK